MALARIEVHAQLVAKAFDEVLGKPEPGSIAFVRCLTPDVVEALARDTTFNPAAWKIWRVADVVDTTARSITADYAVDLRESKGDPVLLLVIPPVLAPAWMASTAPQRR